MFRGGTIGFENAQAAPHSTLNLSSDTVLSVRENLTSEISGKSINHHLFPCLLGVVFLAQTN
jgi:hypothetical protein